MGSEPPKMRVVDYFIDLHFGICHGPIDAINEIYIKEKRLRSFKGPYTARANINIYEPRLFGGDKKDGGVAGTIEYYEGNLTQTMSYDISSRVGRDSTTMPGYRGIANIFCGGGGYVQQSLGIPILLESPALSRAYLTGFQWSSNNPYLPSIAVDVTRSPKGLSPELAKIPNPPFPDDANPAIIIYECLTNAEWGMGGQSLIIDIPSFELAAQILYDENFGLSLMWVRPTTIEKFIEEILDHIQATLFQDTATGKLTIVMYRDDYNDNIDDLPVLDKTNAVINDFSRKSWGETVNEIVVTWTNPKNEQEETVTYQDLSNIAIQNAVISDSRNYYGVRNSELALRLAVRDVRSASYPLAIANVTVDRRSFDFFPGQVVKLVSEIDGVKQIIMRINNIDYGTANDAKITMVMTEDIFSLEVAEFEKPPESQWESGETMAAPLDYIHIQTLPRGILALMGIAPDISREMEQYPRVVSLILGQTDKPDTRSFTVFAPATLPNGDTTIASRGDFPLLSRAVINTILPKAAISSLPNTIFEAFKGNYAVGIGSFGIIGTSEKNHEFILFSELDRDTAVWTVYRGVLDTIPREWPADTPIWFPSLNRFSCDTSEIMAGETIPYQLSPETSLNLLPLDDTPITSYTATERPYLPTRPANVKINNVSFEDVTQSTSEDTIVTWSNRNRLTEDLIIKKWTDGNVTPEEGQTTIIRIRRASDNDLITEYRELTGISLNIPYSAWENENEFFVEVLAHRQIEGQNMESIQFVRQKIIVPDINLPGIPVPVINGGFETGDLTGWETVTGFPQVVERDSSLNAQEGSYFFRATGGVDCEIRQDVDISNLVSAEDISNKKVTLSTFIWQTDKESYDADQGRFVVEALNNQGTIISTLYDSGFGQHGNAGIWNELGTPGVEMPAGCTQIRYRVLGKIVRGTQINAPFDSLVSTLAKNTVVVPIRNAGFEKGYLQDWHIVNYEDGERYPLEVSKSNGLHSQQGDQGYYIHGNTSVRFEIRQDVDITHTVLEADIDDGHIGLFAFAWQCSTHSNGDPGAFIVESLNSENEVVETLFDSGIAIRGTGSGSNYKGVWQKIIAVRDVLPAFTRKIRYRLVGELAAGSINNTAFDSVSSLLTYKGPDFQLPDPAPPKPLPQPARYWRILFNNTFGHARWVTVSEVFFLDAANTDTTTIVGGIPSASSFYDDRVTSRAFDRDANTKWTTATDDVFESWIQWDYGDTNDQVITSFAITSNADLGENPTGFILQSSIDGITWNDIHKVTALTPWSSREKRTFNIYE